MELNSPKIIKEIFEKHNIKPNKILGQNFLIDKNILEKIIKTSDLKPTDIILEAGPGIGTLTKELAKNTKKVIAVEKDKIMFEVLKETLKDYKNIELINQDILKFEITEKYKVVANIPYYLTSVLIRKLLESENQPQEIILLIQKEVAQRICASPAVASAKEGKTTTRRRQGYGGRGMSLLSVSVQFYAEPKIISYVSKNCFLPAPKIDSAIIKITPFSADAGLQQELFFKIVKAGFSQPRKQLSGNLSKILKLPKTQTDKWLIENNINPTQRAETLSIEDWKNLTKTL